MYVGHEPFVYNNGYGQVPYLPLENLYPFGQDERQIGGQWGGQMGPPGPPPGVPGFGPPGQGQQAGPPSAPPPSYVPSAGLQAGVMAVDPGSMRRCLFRYTYVWLRGRQQFWFYPTFLGRRSVSGYRWTGFTWVYFGVSLRQIQSFTCV